MKENEVYLDSDVIGTTRTPFKWMNRASIENKRRASLVEAVHGGKTLRGPVNVFDYQVENSFDENG